MNSLLTRLYVRATEQKGQALTEYAVILGLILVVSIVAMGILGTSVNSIFGVINTDLAAVPGV